MPLITLLSNYLRILTIDQYVSMRAVDHREFIDWLDPRWGPYRDLPPGILPPDAVMARREMGVVPYYLHSLTFVDLFGLMDPITARHPVLPSDPYRLIAHERRPPPGHLAARGVNITVLPALRAPTPELRSEGRYAVRVAPGLWMPFDSPDHAWVLDRFSAPELSLHVAEILTPR